MHTRSWRVVTLVAVAAAVTACSSASEPSPTSPAIRETVQVVASAETTRDLGVVVWGVDLSADGHLYSTGYDASAQPVFQLAQRDELADAGRITFQVTYPAARTLTVTRDATGHFTTTSDFAASDFAAARDLDTDLRKGKVNDLPPDTGSLTTTRRAVAVASGTRPQDLDQAGQLLYKYGKCLYENRTCLLALGGGGASLLSMAASCSIAGVDGVALVACIVGSVVAPEAVVPEACVAATAALEAPEAAACAAAYEAAQATVPSAIYTASVQCSTKLAGCF